MLKRTLWARLSVHEHRRGFMCNACGGWSQFKASWWCRRWVEGICEQRASDVRGLGGGSAPRDCGSFVHAAAAGQRMAGYYGGVL